MNNELISVVVPCYNVEKYLMKCIQSLISQTYKNIEIILVDDGSTDNCGKICDELKSIDKRIKVYHKKNGGLSDARNYGLSKASGKYISFIDSDDYVSDNFIQILYENLLMYNADISIVGYIEVYENDELSDKINNKGKIIELNRKQSIRHLFDPLSFGNYAWNKLYKRELFDDICYPVNKKMEDLGTTYKLFYKCDKIVYDDRKLYYYLQRNGSILHNINISLCRDKYILSLERYNFLKDVFPDLSENSKFLYSMFLDYYSILYKDIDIRKNICKILGRFSFNILKNLSFKYKIKYLIFSFNHYLYYCLRRNNNYD